LLFLFLLVLFLNL